MIFNWPTVSIVDFVSVLKSPDPSAIVNERRVSKCVLMKNAEAENQ